MWSWEERQLHINILWMKVVILALKAFLNRLSGESIILMSDNAIVVAYLKKQGGTVSKVLCDLEQR